MYKDGGEYWNLDGHSHRLGGPAVIYPSGSVTYYLNGILYMKDQHGQILRTNQSSG